MRRLWLLFAQTVTVLLALWFVLTTLQPEGWPRLASPTGVGPVWPDPVADTSPRPASGLSAAAQKASPAVVSINTLQRSRSGRRSNPWMRPPGDESEAVPSGLGSGVIISAQGHVLTNNHVIEDADGIEVVLTDGRKATARVIGTDPETDLALLRIELPQLPVIDLGRSEGLRVGDTVLAIGNPFGVGQTVTAGIVSALGRNQLGINTFENFIQTDAAINPGNSGGALVDVQGRLVGINTAIYSRSGGNMGIGFAIPVSSARKVVDDLLQQGRVTRGWLGVEPQEWTVELAQSLRLPTDPSVQGVLITGVLKGGPAAQSGVQAGDVITQVNGQAVANVSELLARVAGLTPGEPAQVQVLRGRERLQLAVTPGQRPAPRREARSGR